MERLLLYVHYNKFNFISGHVLYQLEKIRPLYSRVVFISNSQSTRRCEGPFVAINTWWMISLNVRIVVLTSLRGGME